MTQTVRMARRFNDLVCIILGNNYILPEENWAEFKMVLSGCLDVLHPEHMELLRDHYIRESSSLSPYERVRLVEARRALVGAMSAEAKAEIEALVEESLG